ncbi:MAG: hypothetical protein AAF390_06395 [Pseudomonadota bacterium]
MTTIAWCLSVAILSALPAQADQRFWPGFGRVHDCADVAPNLTFALLRGGAATRSIGDDLRGRLLGVQSDGAGRTRVLLERANVCAPTTRRTGTTRTLTQREARAAARATIAAHGCRVPSDDIARFERSGRRYLADRIVLRSADPALRSGLAAAALVHGTETLLARGELVGDPGRNGFLLKGCGRGS